MTTGGHWGPKNCAEGTKRGKKEKWKGGEKGSKHG